MSHRPSSRPPTTKRRTPAPLFDSSNQASTKPGAIQTTDSHLRCHLRPFFGRRQLRQITPSIVLRWQQELEGTLSHSGVMACRSILLRILQVARKNA
jgi:hypothetical protein